jgi:hypothetical protein
VADVVSPSTSLSPYIGIAMPVTNTGIAGAKTYQLGDFSIKYGDVNNAKIEIIDSKTIKICGKISGASKNLWGFSVLGDTSHLKSTWWNSSYLARNSINISNTAGNLYNFQVNVSLNTATLISNGTMRGDCNDSRFTWLNGTTEQLISYWLEANCNTTYTRYWVNVPYMANNTNTTVYLYHGNANATGNSTFNSTFTKQYNITAFNTVDNSLIMDLLIDEGDNNSVADTSSYGNNVMFNGTSLLFDGINDYVNITGTVGLNMKNNKSSFSILAWVNPATNNMNIGNIMARGYEVAPLQGFYRTGLSIIYNQTLFYLGSNNVSGSTCPFFVFGWYYLLSDTSKINITANQWYFIASVYNGTDMLIYINGVLNTNCTAKIDTPANYGTWRIGADYNTNTKFENFFNGTIDEVRYFNTTVSAKNITDFYNDYIILANSVGAWLMVERSGTTILDYNFNGNNGILSGATWVNDTEVYPFWQPIDGGQWGDRADINGSSASFFKGSNLLFSIDKYIIKNPFSNFPAKQLTAEFWVKGNNYGNYDGLISYASATKNNEFFIGNSSTNIVIGIGNYNVSTGVKINDTLWHYIAVTWQNTDGALKLYKDGINVYSGTLATGVNITSNGLFLAGQYQSSLGIWSIGNFYYGQLDEIKIYNRTLSAGEIYSHYIRSRYATPSPVATVYPEELLPDIPPIVSLINPADGNITYVYGTAINKTFICNATDDWGLNNVSLWTNISGTWAINQTIDLAGLNLTVYLAEFNVTDITAGSYIWNCQAWDNGFGGTKHNAFNPANRTFYIINIVYPSVSIQLPQNTTYTIAYPPVLPLNYTATAGTFSVAECWYSLDDADNVSLSLCQNIIFNITFGSHGITVYLNDTLGNINSSTVYFTVVLLPYLTVEYINPTPLAGSTHGFDYNTVINISFFYNYNITEITLFWNNVSYAGTDKGHYSDWAMPTVAGTVYSYFARVNMSDGSTNTTDTRLLYISALTEAQSNSLFLTVTSNTMFYLGVIVLIATLGYGLARG